MKFDRRPPPPKIGFFVIFWPVFLADFRPVLQFVTCGIWPSFALPPPLNWLFGDIFACIPDESWTHFALNS